MAILNFCRIEDQLKIFCTVTSKPTLLHVLPSSRIIYQGWGLIDLPLRAPAHPLTRRNVPLSEARAFRSILPTLPYGEQPDCPSLHCAHRTLHILPNVPSKLACFFSPGRAPMLVYVRPSNEALLRARVPGAQDQRGWPSIPLSLRTHLNIQQFDFPMEMAPLNFQIFSCARNVPVMLT
jgi:hypothetical protein